MRVLLNLLKRRFFIGKKVIKMTCSAEIKENQACIDCKIKKIINQDVGNSDYLDKNKVPQGTQVVRTPRNAWIGVSSKQIVYCDRRLGILVK